MNFVALDLETTGTLSYTDHIVELAVVRFIDGRERESFSSLINPGVSMPEEASRVNGITDKMLKGQPKIEEVLKTFYEFCAGDILVAHNAIFDFQFLAVALEKHHLPPPPGPLFDTYSLSKKIFPGLSNYKLSTLAEYLKISESGFHRAKQDASACGKLFNVILKKIKPKAGGLWDLRGLSRITGKKELRFPALKARQLSFFD